MSYRDDLKKLLDDVVRRYLAERGVNEAVECRLETPRNREYGDFATNVAMQLAKSLKKPPFQIAEEIKASLPANSFIERVEVVKPGFINFALKQEAAYDLLRAIVAAGENFGKTKLGAGKKAQVEFVSANPTGPLHVGHARNAVVGDTTARVLEAAGYDVTREYYFNDAGNQMRNLGLTLQARVLEALGRSAKFPDDGYKGGYMIEIARKLVAERGEAAASETVPCFTEYAVAEILKTIEADMDALGIHFDFWFRESSLHEKGMVDAALEKLRARGHLFEEDGALWLKTTAFGDEKDRVVVKSDKSKTYLAPDIAYHEDKFRRGFEIVVDVLGGDHHGYVPRLKAAVAALGHDPDRLKPIIIQMVTLQRGGDKMKLSTRSGEFITLKEMVDELGADVVRFFFLMRSPDSQLVFDWDLALDTSEKNPVYAVQYAHARCCNIFKRAEEVGHVWPGTGKSKLELLEEMEERDLVKLLARLPEVVNSAAAGPEPHLLVSYLREVAGAFNQYYTMGNKDPRLRCVQPDQPDLTNARLSLIHATRIVLANALRILGVRAPERM